MLTAKDEAGAEVPVRVTCDFGTGIPQEEEDFIFDKFYQGKHGLRHSVKGTGLGLTLVHHIVEAHGGTIHVESEVSRGTTFTILLPFMQKST